jgi:hypothetical protein
MFASMNWYFLIAMSIYSYYYLLVTHDIISWKLFNVDSTSAREVT